LHARRRAAFSLWLANLALGVGIGTVYLGNLPDGWTTRTLVFVCLALISSVATLSLIPGAIAWGVVRWVPRAHTGGLIQAIVGSLFLCLLYADTVVFRILGYHFNSAVLNVMFTSGSEDAVHLGALLWVKAVVVFSLVAGVQYALWRSSYVRALRRDPLATTPAWTRPAVVATGVLMSVLFIEKSIYAAADFELDHQVNSATQLLPIYPRLHVSQILPEGMSSLHSTSAPVEIEKPGEPLDYPHAVPQLDPQGARPNVLILVIDSWRDDCFTPEITPRLYEHSKGARIFENHLSGGNGTRFGVFSMLYGLHGSYWFSFLAEKRSPVLLDVLADAGYERRVFSSASMAFPEFRETAWTDILECVHDDYTGLDALQRDHQVADSVSEWVATRDDETPFFGFILLDAAHQPYCAKDGPFQPAARDLDYIELRNSDDPLLIERMFNKYKNSLLACDEASGRILDQLEAQGLLEDTIVIVTSDHGEEFQEHGFWGHTSNFTLEQVAVPLYVKGPGFAAGVESRPTSHLDLPATLLETLGADPAVRDQWTLGESLLAPLESRDRSVAGWEHLGLHTDSGIFRVRMGGTHGFDVEVFELDWTLAADQSGAWAAEVDALGRLARESRRFLVRRE
jgi:membrane-anchored protein YejM (alkaline phosphatase superfamily)